MKIKKIFYYSALVMFLILVVSACDKAARTGEYFDTHEAERSARIEECKKLDPTEMQSDKDCQAAIMSWSKAEHKRLKEGLNTPQSKSNGIGFKEIR
ncbi:MAG: EexN family lipoprotein [Deltaproteobacteria bacterium]